MKFRTLKRHVREGFKNVFRNGWLTVASVGAVTTTLVLVGAFLVIMLNLNNMASSLEDDVEIDVFIDLTAEKDQINDLNEQIEKISQVDKVSFSSKDEQLEDLMSSMGDEGEAWQLFQQDNPLNNVFIVKTKDPLDTIDVAKKIDKLDNVDKVNYGQDVVQRLFQFNQYARNIGIVIIFGLLFTAIFLISNTIKLNIMSRSAEIGIMKLVGASNNFIRWPFFVEGMLLGMLGSVIPIAAILGGYYYLDNLLEAQTTYSFVKLLPYNPFAWELSLVILIIGAVIGIWGSIMSVRKFLKV